jgi:hypothetical protein
MKKSLFEKLTELVLDGNKETLLIKKLHTILHTKIYPI